MGLYFQANVMALPQRVIAQIPVHEIAFNQADPAVRYHVSMLAETDRARNWFDRILLRYLSKRGYAVTGCWHLMAHYDLESDAFAARREIRGKHPDALVDVFPMREGELLPYEKLRPKCLKETNGMANSKVMVDRNWLTKILESFEKIGARNES